MSIKFNDDDRLVYTTNCPIPTCAFALCKHHSSGYPIVLKKNPLALVEKYQFEHDMTSLIMLLYDIDENEMSDAWVLTDQSPKIPFNKSRISYEDGLEDLLHASDCILLALLDEAAQKIIASRPFEKIYICGCDGNEYEMAKAIYRDLIDG